MNAAVLQIANTSAALYAATVSERLEMPADEAWLIAHRRSLGNRPLLVLTAQDHNYDNAQTPPDVHRQHLATERDWAQLQRAYLPLSTNSRQILVPKSGHYIQLDQPQVVLAAIQTAAAKH